MELQLEVRAEMKGHVQLEARVEGAAALGSRGCK